MQSDARDLPVIAGLSADLVPPTLYATRRWFYSTPLWYYHAALSADGEARPWACPWVDRHSYQLMDSGVRELCRMLHAAGLRTTGSCEGHFYGRDHFEHVWDELRREAALIVADGLPVRDSETDAALLFRDANYALPWSDFETFYAEAGANQGGGYLGIVVPDACAALADRLEQAAFVISPDHSPQELAMLARGPRLDAQLGGRFFALTVQSSSPDARDRLWRQIADHFRRLLG